MAKKRVHEIAKERGMSSKDVIAVLQKAGLDVKAAASSVDEADIARAFSNGAESAPAEAPKKDAAAGGDGAQTREETAPTPPQREQAQPAQQQPQGDGGQRPQRPQRRPEQAGGAAGRRRRSSRSWATSTTARPRCSMQFARPRSWRARPAASRSTSARIRCATTATRSRSSTRPATRRSPRCAPAARRSPTSP